MYIVLQIFQAKQAKCEQLHVTYKMYVISRGRVSITSHNHSKMSHAHTSQRETKPKSPDTFLYAWAHLSIYACRKIHLACETRPQAGLSCSVVPTVVGGGYFQKSAVAEYVWLNQHSITWDHVEDYRPRFHDFTKENQRSTSYLQTFQPDEQRWKCRGITHLGFSAVF